MDRRLRRSEGGECALPVYGQGLREGLRARVYGQIAPCEMRTPCLRADIALRNAYPLFTGKNDPKMSDI